MSANLILLFALLVIVLLWLDGARARELATAVVAELCQRRGFQLLDETVALNRFGLTTTRSGLRIRRLFQFHYSIEGVGRQLGHILLHGAQVIHVDLATPDDQGQEQPSQTSAGQAAGDEKVIPFRPRR